MQLFCWKIVNIKNVRLYIININLYSLDIIKYMSKHTSKHISKNIHKISGCDATLIPNKSMYYVTIIGNGQLTSNPEILKKKVIDAYLNIISCNTLHNTKYEICYTVDNNQLQLSKDITVHATYFVPKYKQYRKYISHKLKKYKQIIDSNRYYVVDNINIIINICNNSINYIYNIEHVK